MKKSKKVKVEEKSMPAEVITQEEKPKQEEMPKKEEKTQEFLTFEEMTDKQMDHFLFELSNSIYYQAILRLNRRRDGEILNTLVSIDPFSNPTLMSRHQGERIGIFNLEDRINNLIKKNKESNMSKEDKIKNEAETPSYNKW